jgi:hypothetical protein
MLALLLRYWQQIALFAALLTAAWWFNGLLDAKKELSAAQVLISAQETTLDTYKQEEILQLAQIANLSAVLEKVTVTKEQYKDSLEIVSANNELLAKELHFELSKLEIEDIGDTCEKQISWVLSISKDLGTW